MQHVFARKQSAGPNMFGKNMLYSTVALLAKYHVLALFMWALSFLGGSFFADGSIIKNLSLGVGIILGLLTILSKLWEMIRTYRRQSLREEIQRIIRNRELDKETTTVLRSIIKED